MNHVHSTTLSGSISKIVGVGPHVVKGSAFDTSVIVGSIHGSADFNLSILLKEKSKSGLNCEPFYQLYTFMIFGCLGDSNLITP